MLKKLFLLKNLIQELLSITSHLKDILNVVNVELQLQEKGKIKKELMELSTLELTIDVLIE